MNYSEMSDQEINVELASRVLDVKDWDYCLNAKVFYHCGVDGQGYYEQTVPNYCNSWADMGPLIEEYEIGLWTHPDFEGKWSARFNIKREVSVVCDVTQDKNPLRAAAICLLMLLDKGE